MKLFFPSRGFHPDSAMLRHGVERWADITLQGWLLLFHRAARRRAWTLARRHAPWQLLEWLACWLSGTLVLLSLAYLLYLASQRF
ncbi:hypothetical protein [Chromobacterium vaccinii]|uniref:Uncharacterized protein n=1 Tax=Chromobacterium vaccinii TaxID=1108595 RepID=A0A1D9LKH5_9NEIS|nr:hypothetical protein [Chromobacterium vaccinii]AOZ51719.1 hypothetical protein BKX93_18090 [Chromobacterium vaccinii]QND86824.1 Uncharacterized protein ChrSW_4599 [Chromobacterium vaccinii]QND92055.1 Uncharacterized protein ChrSV_4599 [Chromobacterium vaccinii]